MIKLPALSMCVVFLALDLGLCVMTIDAEECDCERMVTLARSDLRSSAAAYRDGEYEIAARLAAFGARRLAIAIPCCIQRCVSGDEAAKCRRFLEDAVSAGQEASRHFLNGEIGDAAQQLGTATAALTMWVRCAEGSCTARM